MPVLTDVQSYAAEVMRSLLCMRREQIHWMIGRKYPQVVPEKIMRQLGHVLRLYDDGIFYRWPGTEPDPERAAAVDIMLTMCRGSLPIIGGGICSPCVLLFFIPVPNSGAVLPYRVYAPQKGDEAQCRAAAESQLRPLGHAVIFLISDKSQISSLRVSHPHIFALKNHNGAFEFLEAKV